MLNANKKKTYIGENFLNPSKRGPKSCFERSSIYNSSHIYVYRVQKNFEPERNGTHPSCQCYSTTTIQDFLKI